MNIYLFNFSENRFEWNQDVALIRADEDVATNELIVAALKHFKEKATKIEPTRPGWFVLDWHRYVVGENLVPAEHPDAQGYFLDVEYVDGLLKIDSLKLEV